MDQPVLCYREIQALRHLHYVPLYTLLYIIVVLSGDAGIDTCTLCWASIPYYHYVVLPGDASNDKYVGHLYLII